MNYEQELGNQMSLMDAGTDLQLFRDEDGSYKIQANPMPYLRTPMRQAEPQTLEETASQIVPTAVGLAGGATAATLGTLQDIGGLIYGGIKSMGAEEGQKLQTFLDTAGEISDKYGSGAVKGYIRQQAEEAGLDEAQLQVLDEAMMAGEFGGIGGLVKAAPKIASKAGDVIVEAGRRAENQLAEGGTTLMSGPPVDDLVNKGFAAAGDVVKKFREKGVGSTDNPVSKDLPEIDPDILINKKIFPIQADLTKAGGFFRGIDSSIIDSDLPLQGGPDFPLLQTSQDGKVVWAVDAKAMTSKKLGKDADYAVVVAMSPEAHQTNATVVKALTDNLLAYARDGRIDAADIPKIDAIIKQPSSDPTLKRMPEFPGLTSPEAAEWMRSASFDERKRIAKVIAQPGVQDMGAPNVQRVLDETSEGAYTGLNLNDSILVIKIDKEAGMIELGKEPGTVAHHSYKFGLKGEPVGRLPMVSVQNMFPDWFKKQAPIWEQKQKAYEAGETQLPPNPRRSFQMNLPVEKITAKKAEKIKRLKVQSIKSPLQARLTAEMMDGKWSTSDDTLQAGGTNALQWVREARASKEGVTLSIPKGEKGERLTDAQAAAKIQEDIKKGDLKLYKLGKKSRTFFGLHKNYNYDEVYEGWQPTPGGPEVGNNEVALVSVLSNDRAANGIGKATVLKAIEEGATVLDCFEVKSGKYPDGFLTTFYGMFDFVEAGRVKFDPQYYSAQELADLEKVWSDRGWNKGDPYPDVVIMKYTGDENARTEATKRFVTEGGFSSGANQAVGAFGSSASDVRGAADQAVGESAVPSGPDTRRGADGDLRAGGQRATTDRLASVAQEILSLSDEQIDNLGLDAATIERLRARYQTGGE